MYVSAAAQVKCCSDNTKNKETTLCKAHSTQMVCKMKSASQAQPMHGVKNVCHRARVRLTPSWESAAILVSANKLAARKVYSHGAVVQIEQLSLSVVVVPSLCSILQLHIAHLHSPHNSAGTVKQGVCTLACTMNKRAHLQHCKTCCSHASMCSSQPNSSSS